MIVLSNDESDFLKNIAFCIQFFHRKSEFSQDEFTEKTGSICSVIFQIIRSYIIFCNMIIIYSNLFSICQSTIFRNNTT